MSIFDLFQIDKVPFWKKDRFPKKRKVGHEEGITKGSYYGKSLLREYHRNLDRVKPATPTSTTLRSGDGRTSYRVFSDGSYRKMIAVKGRKLIPV